MFKIMADNRNRDSVATKLRRKRAAFLMSLLAPLKRPIQILDVGGTEQYWKMMDMEEDEIHISLLNLEAADTSLPNCVSISGDARQLRFEDRSFDVVFSNSVIEHVGDYRDQEQMANEARRVGRRYFIMTAW